MLPETQMLSTFQMITLHTCLPFSITIWLLYLQHWGTVLGRQSRVKGQAIHVRPFWRVFPKAPTWKLWFISTSNHYMQGRYSFVFVFLSWSYCYPKQNSVLLWGKGENGQELLEWKFLFFFLALSHVSSPLILNLALTHFLPLKKFYLLSSFIPLAPREARTMSHIGSVGFLPCGWYGNYTYSFIKPIGAWSFSDHKPYN